MPVPSITNGSLEWTKIAKKFMDKICFEIPMEELPFDGSELDLNEMFEIFKRGLRVESN